MTKIEKIKDAICRGFRYDPETGLIYGISGRQIRRLSYGYIDIAIIINGKNVHIPGHQFAFYITYKYLPRIIDHIDRNRTNNKINNLRAADSTMNGQNVKGKGYYWHNQANKWNAQITVNRKHISLGTFHNEQDAYNAYRKAKLFYHNVDISNR